MRCDLSPRKLTRESPVTKERAARVASVADRTCRNRVICQVQLQLFFDVNNVPPGDIWVVFGPDFGELGSTSAGPNCGEWHGCEPQKVVLAGQGDLPLEQTSSSRLPPRGFLNAMGMFELSFGLEGCAFALAFRHVREA